MGILKGKVINHSDIELWVIETTTNHPHGPPIAHKLSGKRKSPKNIDADGFRRIDAKPIDGHKEWWKILDANNADIYARGTDLKVCVTYKRKMAKTGDLDNVVLAKRGTTRYLRSKPDQLSANNLQEVIVT